MQFDLFDSEKALSVSELTAQIKTALERRFATVCVEGEVWQPSVHRASGHIYFSLKDSAAVLRCVMFRKRVQRLREPLEAGLKVRCFGTLNVYPPQGQYQLVVDRVETSGVGALLVAFERLKKKLQGEGLFDAERKRPLPRFPRRIAIVTSLHGAALRDIVRTIFARYPARLLVLPVRVQGEGAAAEIARAIERAQRIPSIDVLVIGRGGGSLEDLWAFNEEIVVRALARSAIPTVSAVGHEVDWALTDFVADVRAATPTAAGELVVPAFEDLMMTFDDAAQRLEAGLRRRLAHQRLRLGAVRGRLLDPRTLTSSYRLQLSHHLQRLRLTIGGTVERRRRALQNLERALGVFDPKRRITNERAALERLTSNLVRAIRQRQIEARRSVAEVEKSLRTLSPLAVLSRGYAIVTESSEGRALRDVSELEAGQDVEIRLHRGGATARIEAIRGALEDEE
ncbi:MAG: exodeoxyribonuclease VII large subunit [Myxococcales bacterium]|nr:exodeoxyribonuclease VII large subunit [Myxococcales bacterium]